MKWFLLLGVVILAHLGASIKVREYAPIVKTKQGDMVGIVQEYDEYKVHMYEGIRYGRAERFSKPKAPEPWTGVYNATQMQYACPQPSIKRQNHVDLSHGFETGSSNEDCLFLNLWRPATEKANRPIMVWIHGGSFEFGTIFTVIYDGRVIASLGDVIVVTVNYRLGALGFLYGGSEDAPGNLGLYDQIEAIKWVHENALAFGGDPNQITVFGESAGSMSTGALVLSPLTNGLIKRAILQSGSPNSYLGSEEKSKSLEKTKALAEKVHCPETEIKDIVKCLRGVSLEKILEASKGSIADGESFTPIWGEEVMPLNPVQALKTGKFNHIDLMFGVTRNEGSAFVAKLLPLLNPDTDGHDLHITQVKSMINLMFMLFKEPNSKEIAEYYTKNLNKSDKTALRIAVSDAFGDYHLVCPTVLFGEQFAKQAPQNKHFAYQVNHPTSIGIMGCRGWMGVCHGEDVIYTFGVPARIRGLIFSEVEYQISHDLITAWTNFAKSGNPARMGKVEWAEALSHDTVSHMAVNADYKMVEEFYKQKCDSFWKPRIFA